MTTIMLKQPKKVMRTQSVIAQIASASGTTPRDLLIALYNQHRSQVRIAQELGVTQSTVSLEMRRQGLTRIISSDKAS